MNRLPTRATLIALAACGLLAIPEAHADNAAQSTPYAQDWSNGGLITSNDDWSGVPGVIGYLGDNGTPAVTGVDPQTLLDDYVLGATPSAVDVIANQGSTTITSGGVAEFDGIANPVVALQGSGGADYPHLLIHVDTTDRQNLRVRYNLRDVDGSGDNSVQQFALHYRVGNSGNYINLPAGYVADASTGPNLAELVTPVDVTLPPAADNAPLVTLRIMTTNAPGSDEWVGIDDIQLTADGFGGLPIVSIGDVSLAEGNVPGETTAFNFAVSLTVPAPAGGVRFDATSGDGSAVAASDYMAIALDNVLIPEGLSGATVTVMVNHDLVGEENETFSVTLSDLVGGLAGDMTGIGTIQNDDPLEIFEIQGSGTASTLVGAVVTTLDNAVTALAPNGFFMQTPQTRDDGNLATSNGIFVFTGTAPTVAVGDRVNVTGTVQEFFDFTQLSGTPTVTLVGAGALPPPVALDANFPSPLLTTPSCYNNANVEFANFECIEGMRVTIADGTVTAPNQRFAVDPIAEPVIQASPNRSLREPGLETPGYAGIPGSIPIWDLNPETFEIDPDKLLLPNRIMNGGTRFAAEGVIGYDFGDFELWPTSLTILQDAPMPRAVAAPAAQNLSIGSLNMLRFFDTNQANNFNNPASLNCLGAFTCTSLSTCGEVSEDGEYARRMAKFSSYIRNVLRAPDVVAVQEVENIGVLEALAAKIALDEPTLVYTAHLAEGSDVGGIDSGFLVRSGRINAGFTLTQLGKAELFSGDTPPSCLHDRPPFRLDAVFSVGSRPFSVIVNHTRSLSGINDCRPGAAGERLCKKRLAQAESIAQFVQSFQTANPTVPLVVVGDHNAFQFSDGHVDVIGTIRGSAKLAADPNPDSLLAPLADIVEPNMSNAVESLPAQERYSYFFGNALQVLDHAMLTSAAQAAFVGISYGRANVDAPLIFTRTSANVLTYGDDVFNSGLESANEASPLRVSDHDGFVIRLFQ
jgi:predicted extracellular nuclease